jgi:hypothetical protein
MSNITRELNQKKDASKSLLNGDFAVEQFKLLEAGDAAEDTRIANALGTKHSIARAQEKLGKVLAVEHLDKKFKGNIFTVDQIKELAGKYNLRFLQTQHYCGDLDLGVITKIKEFNKETGTEINDAALRYNFYILAPEKCFKLETFKKEKPAPDPAIFYKVNDDHYRLIHQWGTDFSIWRKIAGWNWKNRDTKFNLNLVISTIFMVLLMNTLITAFSLSAWFYCFVLLGVIYSSIKCYSDIYEDEEFHEKKWNSHKKLVKD